MASNTEEKDLKDTVDAGITKSVDKRPKRIRDSKNRGAYVPVSQPPLKTDHGNNVSGEEMMDKSAEKEEEIDPNIEEHIPMMHLHRKPSQSTTTEPHSDSQHTHNISAISAANTGVSYRNTQQQSSSKMAADSDQPSPTGLLGWLGLGLTIFAMASMSVSFASPYWLQTYPHSFNKFKNLGLWEVCFSDYMHHKDDTLEVYDGCWWVFDPEEKYSKLREWLLPPWFIACQVMVVACLIMEAAVVVLVAMIFLHCCPIMNHEYHQTYAMFGASALLFLVSMTSLVVAAVFGDLSQDWYWMPRPDQNFLSWGYGFFVISAICVTAGGICLFLEARKSYDELMRKEEEFTKAAMEMSGYPASTATMGQEYGYPGQPGYDAGGAGYPQGQSYASQPSYQSQPSYTSQPSFEKPPYNDDKGGFGGEQRGGYDQQQHGGQSYA